MKSLKESILEGLNEAAGAGSTLLVTDNIDGKTWKYGVYAKNDKELKYLNDLSMKGGTRHFNVETYDEGKSDIPECGKTLTLKEFEKELEKYK